MEGIFRILYNETNDVSSFQNSLEKNFQAILDFFASSYQVQNRYKDDIKQMILLKNNIISDYSFQTVESRSFVLILLDLCERFALYSCIPRVIRIIRKNDISINKRMSASLKYLYPAPSSNGELLNKFDEICSLLDEAILEEEDNASKSIVTFLNYYAYIIYNTNYIYATRAREKFKEVLNSHRYHWLDKIKDIVNLDVADKDLVLDQIENKIDDITLKIHNSTLQGFCEENVLIEENTDYCLELASVPNNFLSVRQISVKHADGSLTGRGVSLLNTEAEMFEYLKRFGKMHYAKLLSSFTPNFPQHFTTSVNIVDWGCGQGIASMTFIEKYGASVVNSITLIEPSEIVIKRASLHCKKFAPNAFLRTICKKFDDIVQADIKTEPNSTTIHLFSNILDIDDYNIKHLLDIVDSVLTNKNYFICVSPYIDDIKSAKLNIFMKHFMKRTTFSLYHDIENTKQGAFWLCNNSFQKKHFAHGCEQSCKSYDASGCSNKWTRILKVFSV